MQKAMYKYNLLALNAGNKQTSTDTTSNAIDRQTQMLLKGIQKNKVRVPNTANELAAKIAHEMYRQQKTNWHH
jgi:hypothetical protein